MSNIKKYKYKCSKCDGIVNVTSEVKDIGFFTNIKQCNKCTHQHSYEDVYYKLIRL